MKLNAELLIKLVVKTELLIKNERLIELVIKTAANLD